MKTPCFTLNYAAPEVLKQALPSSSKSSDSSTAVDSSLGSSITHSSSEFFTVQSNNLGNVDNNQTTNQKQSVGTSNSLDYSDTGNTDGYNESCDLWSLGVILYTMLAGKAPFQSSSRDLSAAKMMTRINEGEFSFSEPHWSCVSQCAKEVIKGLLRVNPRERTTLSELLKSSWLRQFMSNSYLQEPPTPFDLPNCETQPGQTVEEDVKNYNTFRHNGFPLIAVANAPLAKRRIQKKSSDVRSSCSSSGMSSFSASTQTTLNSNLSQSSLCTPASLVKKASFSDNDYVFNYSECKVNAYLSGLSSDESLALDVKEYGKYTLPFTSCKFIDNLFVSTETEVSPLFSKRNRDDSVVILDEIYFPDTTSSSSQSQDSRYGPSKSGRKTKRTRLNTIVVE